MEKRKAEELERGAHEYANYLVSMLNAGITVANLGVSKQKWYYNQKYLYPSNKH